MVVKSRRVVAHRYRAQQNDSTRDQLIFDNMQFAQKILGQMVASLPAGVEKDDLYSSALLGLTEAANKFEPDRGASFQTFAYPRIRGAIIDQLRKNSQLPQKVLKNIRQIRDAMENIEPPATPESISSVTGLSVTQVEECLSAMKVCSPDTWDEIGGLSHYAIDCPSEKAEQAEMLEKMADCIEKLPTREKSVLMMYYLDSMLLKEIGAVFEISESRASRILARAELMLKQLLLAQKVGNNQLQ